MKKMREVNYIFYITFMYMLSSLYTVLNKGKVYRVFDIKKLIKYDSLLIIVVGLGIIFLLVNYYRNTKQVLETVIFKIILPVGIILLGLNYPNFGLDGIIYAMGIYLIIIYILIYSSFYSKKNIDESENKKEPELYPSRRNLVEILKHALREYSLIALDGTWGSGKTTFMNIAMRENRGKYYYIPINVMLFENRNSLKTEFLNQLKGIFKEEGIFQGSLMDFDYYLDGVSNDWIRVVKNIIFSKSKSFKEANEKLKSEIGKIEKKVVVGVDNLERIYGESEPEWKQILGFIHELQELGIKVVVMANLEEMLMTKKETGEKDLSNHEYFDKFYEFKLQLNEVTTEEIIDGIEIKKDKGDKLEAKENTVNREWLKEQIKTLTINFNEGTKNLKSENLSGNKSEEEKRKSQEDLSKYRELENRYLENIMNPRKIEKVIKDIQTKQKNIFNFIGEEEYKKLIFRASMFSLVYFDYMKEMKEKGFLELHGKNSFFRYFFLRLADSSRGINRLLFYDSKENLIIEEMKKLISTGKITLSTIDKSLKDLEVYSSSLDPDYNQKTTKKAYKIIELKLVELEKTDKKKIHEIIKENEEFICKINYLCNPESYKFYEKISYKFKTQKISMQYRSLIDEFNSKNSRYNNLNDDICWMISSYYIGNNQYIDNVTEKEIVNLIELIDEEKNPNIIMELKNSSLDLFFSEEAERIKLKRMITLLNILKIELNKQKIENKKEGLIITVEQWREPDKLKILQKLENDYCYDYFYKKYEDFKKVRIILEEIIKTEKTEEYILKLESLIKSLKIHELPSQIREMASKIKMEQDLDIKEKKKGELIDFINEKTKEEKYRYIYEKNWTEWKDRLLDIGINMNINGSVEKQNEI